VDDEKKNITLNIIKNKYESNILFGIKIILKPKLLLMGMEPN